MQDKDRNRPRGLQFMNELHRLRVQAGLTQEAIAFEAGVSEGMVARLERGERHPSLEMATRLADVLSRHLCRHVSLDEFRTAILKEGA